MQIFFIFKIRRVIAFILKEHILNELFTILKLANFNKDHNIEDIVKKGTVKNHKSCFIIILSLPDLMIFIIF